jgi:hypothetical protein
VRVQETIIGAGVEGMKVCAGSALAAGNEYLLFTSSSSVIAESLTDATLSQLDELSTPIEQVSFLRPNWNFRIYEIGHSVHGKEAYAVIPSAYLDLSEACVGRTETLSIDISDEDVVHATANTHVRWGCLSSLGESSR